MGIIDEHFKKMEEADEICSVLETILKHTFPKKFLTVMQITVNYRRFTGKYITQERIKNNLDAMVQHCYKNQMYCINEKGHYKHLF